MVVIGRPSSMQAPPMATDLCLNILTKQAEKVQENREKVRKWRWIENDCTEK